MVESEDYGNKKDIQWLTFDLVLIFYPKMYSHYLFQIRDFWNISLENQCQEPAPLPFKKKSLQELELKVKNIFMDQVFWGVVCLDISIPIFSTLPLVAKCGSDDVKFFLKLNTDRRLQINPFIESQ